MTHRFPHPFPLRKWVLTFCCSIFAVGLVFANAAPASAHANLLFSTPADGSTITAMPTTFSIDFDEPVTIQSHPVSLTGPTGRVRTGSASLSHDGRSVDIAGVTSEGRGLYVVNWQVTASDGDVIAGGYRFAVGPHPVALSDRAVTYTKAPWLTGLLRAFLFGALALLLGEVAGRRVLVRVSNRPEPPRSLALVGAVLGVGASLGLLLLIAGNGSLREGLGRPLGWVTSPPGVGAATEAGAFALSGVLAIAKRFRWVWFPVAVVIAAEALRAHPGAAHPLVGIPLTALHLGSTALWVGTLVYVLRTVASWRRHPTAARQAIAVYSRPAAWIFVLIVLSGLGSALLLVPMGEVLTTLYGRVLTVKIGAVVLAAGCAFLARKKLRDRRSVPSIQRPATLEIPALAIALALSAVLTVLPPPANPTAPLPFAPTPSGPVVPAATLAGYVEVNAQASAGQLVLKLDAPDSGATSMAPPRLSAALADPAGRVSKLTFRSCGTGCFVTPMNWEQGTSSLSVSPSARGWPTVTAGLSINWPARPSGGLLTNAITAMKKVPALTLHERVTSNSSQGLGEATSFPMSGSSFIANALFGSGNMPAVVRLPDENGNQRVVISYPSESAVDTVTINTDGLIIAETLVAPSHVITHTITYPSDESHW